MESTFMQAELLTAMEILRERGSLAMAPFLPSLPKPLWEAVTASLPTENAQQGASMLAKALEAKDPVTMKLPKGSPLCGLLATSLEDLLVEAGPALILVPKTPLPFPVRLVLGEKTPPPKPFPDKAVVSIAGLGDVGGTLLMGLRLLGGEGLKEIRIYDPNPEKVRRYYLEINEVGDGDVLPPVVPVEGDALFEADAFIFTVSLFIPPLDTSLTDVRLVQLEKNKRVLLDYAARAEAAGFSGHYFIMSDPVDLLCQSLKVEGGVPGHRIRGFGLGVMEARARFLAREAGWHAKDLRVAGPHGKGILVFNSLTAYDEARSMELSHRTEVENFRVRKTGFKPYIAPALSSGALPILAALRGEMHPSAFDAGTIFLGAQNQLLDGFTLPERVLPWVHLPRLQETEALLQRLYEAPALPEESQHDDL